MYTEDLHPSFSIWILFARPPLPHDDQLVTKQDHQRDLECSPEVCGNVLSEMLASLLGEKDFLATLASAAFSPEKNPDCLETVIDDPVPFWRQIGGNRQELDLFGDSEGCREPPTTPEKVKEEEVPSEQTAVTEELSKSLSEYTRADINLEDSEWQDLMRKFKSCADCRLLCERILRAVISDLCTEEKDLAATDSLDAKTGHGIVLTSSLSQRFSIEVRVANDFSNMTHCTPTILWSLQFECVPCFI
nr:unnamed protein product [Spirometra erinaceieuropaei]